MALITSGMHSRHKEKGNSLFKPDFLNVHDLRLSSQESLRRPLLALLLFIVGSDELVTPLRQLVDDLDLISGKVLKELIVLRVLAETQLKSSFL